MRNDKLELETITNRDKVSRVEGILEKDLAKCYQDYLNNKQVFTQKYQEFLTDETSQSLQAKVKSKVTFDSINNGISQLIKQKFPDLPKLREQKDSAFNEYMNKIRTKNSNIFLLQTYDKDYTSIGTVTIQAKLRVNTLTSELDLYDPNIIDYAKSNKTYLESNIEKELEYLESKNTELNEENKNYANIVIPKILNFLKSYIPFVFYVYNYFNPNNQLNKLIKEINKFDNKISDIEVEIKKTEKLLYDYRENLNKIINELGPLEEENKKHDSLALDYEKMEKSLLNYPNEELHEIYNQYKTNRTELDLIDLCESIIRCGYAEILQNRPNPLESCLSTLQDLHPELRNTINALNEGISSNLRGDHLMQLINKKYIQHMEEDRKITNKSKNKKENINNINKKKENEQITIEEIIKEIENLINKQNESYNSKTSEISSQFFSNPIQSVTKGVKLVSEGLKDYTNLNKLIKDNTEKLDTAIANKESLEKKLYESIIERNEYIIQNRDVHKKYIKLSEKISSFFNEKTSENFLSLYLYTKENQIFAEIAELLEQLYPKALEVLLAKDTLMTNSNFELLSQDIKALQSMKTFNTDYGILIENIKQFAQSPTWGNYDGLQRALAGHSEYYQYQILESLIDRIMAHCVQHNKHQAPLSNKTPSDSSNNSLDNLFKALYAERNHREKTISNFTQYMIIDSKFAQNSQKNIQTYCAQIPDSNRLLARVAAFIQKPNWSNLTGLDDALQKNPDAFKKDNLDTILTACLSDLLKNIAESQQTPAETIPKNKAPGFFDRSTTNILNELNNTLGALQKETGEKQDAASLRLQDLVKRKNKIATILRGREHDNRALWDNIQTLNAEMGPYILAYGEKKKDIHDLYGYLDKLIAIHTGTTLDAKELTKLYSHIHSCMSRLTGHPLQEIVEFILEKIEETDEYLEIPQHPSYKM